MTREEIIRKIKKCLKLSASANEYEAGLALQRAQEMMAKHGVSIHDVELSEITRHRSKATASRRPPNHVVMLADVVKRAFGCECLFSSRRRAFEGWTCDAQFIGADANPEIAAYAFSVLLRQMERGRKAYLGTLSRRMRPRTKAKRAPPLARMSACMPPCTSKKGRCSDYEKVKAKVLRNRKKEVS